MSRKKWALTTGIALAAALLGSLLIRRVPAEADGTEQALGDKSAPIAAVALAQRRSLSNTLTIAGEFKPFQEVDIHAKVAGYIRTIYVDVGDRVKEGQTLAVLEIPELSAELAGADASVRRAGEEILRAEGNRSRAQSAHAAAHSAYSRLKQASESRSGLVAQQELDDAQAKDLESEAQVTEAQAALSASQQQLHVAEATQKQYKALSNYSHITAPFDGVVTKRFADTGALIQAGTASNTQAMPIVRLAQISKLRLVLPVPESAAAQIHLGDAVNVHVQALDQDFEGKVSRFADSLDRQTRTMETEIDFQNGDGRLITGMYAGTHLSLRGKEDALTIPLRALARNGDDATVLLVNSQNVVEERRVRLGLEDDSRAEVLSGVKEGDRVIIGNRSEFQIGQKVRPKDAGSVAGKAQGAS